MYEGYKWIKVPRFKDDLNLSFQERFEKLSEHHVLETSFLIEEIRKLAQEIDDLKSGKI